MPRGGRGYVAAVSDAEYEYGSDAAVPGTLRAKVASGTAWSMGASLAVLLSRAVVAVVLARLLTPAEYGLAGMALLFTALVLVVSDVSLGAALVQRRSIDELDRSTVFWTSVAIGTGLTIGGIAVSGLVASFFRQPDVQPMLAVVSISFLLMSLQMTQASLLQREMHFRAGAVRIAGSVVVGGIVAVVAALLGAGAWTLIAQQLAVSATSVVLLWTVSAWRPKLMFSRARLRSLGGFGLSVFGANLVGYVNRNADNVLVGRYLGTGALGIYSVAYNVMLLPLSQLIVPLQDALYPAFARVQHDKERVAGIWLRVTTVVAGIVAPAMAGLAVVAPDFVDVVLGRRWAAAAPILRILALVTLVQSVSSLGQKMLQALDRARTVLHFSVAGMILTVASFVVGLRWGIVGVASSYACVAVPIAVAFSCVTARALSVPLARLGSSVRGVFEATSVMVVVALVAQASLDGTSSAVRLALTIVAAALVYVPMCAWRVPLVRVELRRLLRRRRARVSVAGAADS